MAPKKNEPAKDKEDKDDATPEHTEPEPEPEPEPETEPNEPEPEPRHEPETEPTQMEPEPEPEPQPEPTRLDPEPEAELETPAPTTGQASGSGASCSRAPIAEAPRRVPEFLSMCTDEEVFGTEEEQRQRAAEKRKQALDITGTPGPERKTKLMTVASYDDFFDERDGSQEHDSYSDFTSRSWTIHWFKNASAEVEIYLYIELHKASLLTGKDFFDDPKGPLLACIGKIKDVELDSAGNYESYYAWTLVERNVLAHALTSFASGEIDIDDLANIDKDFKNALPYVNTLAVPPALNGFNNTVHKNRDFSSEEYEPLALTMANFKELVAAHEGGENPGLADSSSYKPEIDVIIDFLSAYGARQANIDGSHRREAKRMVKENYPEIYKANKGIHLTSAKMYIGLSPEVCRYMSMKLNEAGHTVVGDTSMHKLLEVGFGPHAPWLDEPSLAKQSDSADLPVGQMYLVVGLLIQGEHSVTPSLYELVDDIKHAGDNGPMAVTHTNAEWLAMIETWRFRDLLRRASIKLMNVIDTAKGRETIQLLTPDEPARNWGKYLSDHIIDWDVQDKVSDEQATARLDAITKFRANVDDLGPTGFPRKFQDLFKEHIAATNTTIRSEAYRIKNQMPDLVISFFTEFALLACAPELIAVSAPNVSNELWISMKAEELPVMPKGEEVDKDDKVWLNTELCKTCIVEGNFKAPATKQFVADAMSAVRAKKATVFIADALFGAGSHTWDSKDAAWGTDDFNDVFAFARQDNPHNPAVQKQAEDLIYHVLTWAKDCGMKMGSSLRHDAEYYLYVRKPPPSIIADNIRFDDPRRFSTSIMLGHFKDSSKLKDENRQTVNKYQKPIALFAKHLKMAATDGTTIVDVTAGTGTTAVAAAFSVWWDHMDHTYSFTHRNMKIILIDNQKTQIAGMKSRMTSWFKEKPWDETQQLRPSDFEKWPGLPHPMTVSEEFSERLAAAKKRQEAAERRGDYVIEDDDM
eukprot:jgi/Tetstr1/428262/TSEL_018301.t1